MLVRRRPRGCTARRARCGGWTLESAHPHTTAACYFPLPQAQEVHDEVRKWLAANVSPEAAAATRIIYGGSGEQC